MEMRSVSHGTAQGNIPLNSNVQKNEYPNLTNLKDSLTRLGKEEIELKEQLTVLQSNIASFKRSKNVNQKAKKVTTGIALAGGAAFMTAAFMSSGVGFIVGGAIGAVSYVASGWFKGRTQWFTGQEDGEYKKLNQVRDRRADVKQEKVRLEKAVTKAETEVANLKEGLTSSVSGAIKDKSEYVEIGGVKLRKNKPGVFKYLDDLFAPLDKS